MFVDEGGGGGGVRGITFIAQLVGLSSLKFSIQD